MRKPVLLGSGLMAAALLIGCGGGSEEDKIYRETEQISNEMITMLEKFKNDAKGDPTKIMDLVKKMEETMKPMAQKMADLEKRVKALPKDKQDALEKRVKESPFMKKLEALKQ